MVWLRVPEMVIQALVTPEDIGATPGSDILTVLEIAGHEPVSQTGRKHTRSANPCPIKRALGVGGEFS